jgi:uncharacterized membrane protein YqhA
LSFAIVTSVIMVVKHKVEGYEAFVSKMEEITKDKSKTLIVMFSGTKDEDGKRLHATLICSLCLT